MSKLYRVKSHDSFVKAIYDESPRFSKLHVSDYIKGDYAAWSGCTGRGVKVCLIDSGVVDHANLKSTGAAANIGPSEHSLDINGHATAAAGLIASNDSGAVLGIAPDAILLSAKATNDRGEIDDVALTAAVLWAVLEGAQVIVVPHVVPHVVPERPAYLDAAIAKAIAADVVVVMDGTAGVTLPAGVLSTGGMMVPDGPVVTTYTDDRYAEVMSGDFTTSILGGIAAMMIESRPAADKKSANVTKRLSKLLARDKE